MNYIHTRRYGIVIAAPEVDSFNNKMLGHIAYALGFQTKILVTLACLKLLKIWNLGTPNTPEKKLIWFSIEGATSMLTPRAREINKPPRMKRKT